jgi:TonB family protein
MPSPSVPPRPALTLLESAHAVSFAERVAHALSIVAQMTVAAALVANTARQGLPPEPSLSDRPTFLAPLIKPQPRPAEQHLTFASLGGTAVLDPAEGVGTARPAASDRAIALQAKVGSGDNTPPSVAHDDEAMRAYSEIEVDSAATRDPESEGPVYPPTLMAKGIEGSVLATFVVDENGRPDVTTYIPLEATDPLFASAVRDALPRMKFRPAKRNNVPVRQQVEQRFSFRVIKPAVVKPVV